MDPELASLVVRSYNPMRHRTRNHGYLNRYIQEAVACLINAITEDIDVSDGLINLIGSKCSGTALGVVAQYLYPSRFRFACAEHKGNIPALNEIHKITPEKVILVDDFICDGDTVARLRQEIAFSKVIVLHAESVGFNKVAKLAKVHILSSNEWMNAIGKAA